MKRILIYGDSNVYGDNFSDARIRYSDRWVNRLARSLHGKAQFVVDGACGRVAGDFRKDYQTADAILKNLELYRQSAGDVKTIFILPPAFDTGDKSGPEFTNESEEVRQQLLQLRDRLGNCFELPNIDLSDGLHFSPRGHYQVFKSVKYMLKSHL